MPLANPVSALLTAEWARFKDGVANLNPEQQSAAVQSGKRRVRQTGEAASINIPGWDDVVHITPKVRATSEERSEYWNAKAERRDARISAEARGAIERGQAQANRIRTSAQPDYLQAWGSILTALDNVQDLASTISTMGRLTVWGVGALPESVSLAGALARVPGAAGAAELLTRVALLVEAEAAALGLVQTAPGAATRAASLAEWSAIRAERSALLGALARVPGPVRAAAQLLVRSGALRLLPYVGVVLLVSDLLNLLSLVGMIATPLYAMACAGPSAALAAGFPTAVFKRGPKKILTSLTTRNPLARGAHAKRLLKAASHRIGLPELIEAAQTTDQMFGIGLSFGGVVGLLAESAASVELAARGVPVQVNAPLSYEKSGQAMSGWMAGRTTLDVIAERQAAAVLGMSPGIARVQQHFTAEEHVLTLAMCVHACGVLRAATRGLDVDDLLDRVLDDPLTVPVSLLPDTRDYLAHGGVDPDAPGRWWLSGFPTVTTGTALLRDAAITIPAALAEFRRNHAGTPLGMLHDTLVAQLTEHLWLTLTDDPEAIGYTLDRDWYMIERLAEDGFLLSHADPPERLWSLWQDARAEYVRGGDHPPDVAWWRAATARHRVVLIPQLPPEAPWPAAWAGATPA